MVITFVHITSMLLLVVIVLFFVVFWLVSRINNLKEDLEFYEQNAFACSRSERELELEEALQEIQEIIDNV